MLTFIVKAENFTAQNFCSKPWHFEPVNDTNPHLDNGTDFGAISNIIHFVEDSGKAF